jgi:hypothetical protein
MDSTKPPRPARGRRPAQPPVPDRLGLVTILTTLLFGSASKGEHSNCFCCQKRPTAWRPAYS